MATSHTKALALVDRARKAAARHRAGVRKFETELVRKGTLLSAAGALGLMKQHGMAQSIAGVPVKLPLAAGALIVAAVTRSPIITAVASGLGDAASTVYVYEAVATKNWVAGGGEI